MECDIIIPVWNQRAVTEECARSILENTAGDYRIIVIDNASADETRQYLERLVSERSSRVMLIRNAVNEGFIKAVNKGIEASAAEYVCLLNNDTLVFDGWLTEMIKVAQADKTIGIVNPSSNNLGQRPAEGEALHDYAAKLRPLSGRSVELGSAIGFCMKIS